METSPGSFFSDLAAGLGARFAGDLSLTREGNTVRWSCGGAAAIVSLNASGTLDATFLDAPARDAVTAAEACCVYRSSTSAYGLTHEGCRRMAADLAEFFSGVREPRFTFVGAA